MSLKYESMSLKYEPDAGALLTAMFCVAVVVFFSLRKALGAKQVTPPMKT